MIKPISELRYLTLDEAANRLPSRPHKNTVIRWTNKGYNGIVLKSCKHGKRRMTAEEWIDEFLAKINGTEVSISQVSHTEAERALDAMGVK